MPASCLRGLAAANLTCLHTCLSLELTQALHCMQAMADAAMDVATVAMVTGMAEATATATAMAATGECTIFPTGILFTVGPSCNAYAMPACLSTQCCCRQVHHWPLSPLLAWGRRSTYEIDGKCAGMFIWCLCLIAGGASKQLLPHQRQQRHIPFLCGRKQGIFRASKALPVCQGWHRPLCSW